jgi:hypothetical protein
MASLLDLAQARLGGLLAPQRQSMAGLLGGRQQTGTLAGALQGYTPPQMTAMTNPQVMDYARNVAQSAQQNLQTQMSDLDKALVMDQGGINVGDRQALARLMEQIPGLMGATAYHGTPHNIRGQFDISKVGTGEGAQAYGHGMYFAENPAVAKQYATDRSYVGKVMAGTPDNTPWDALRIAQDTLNVHGDNAVEQLQKTLKANSQLKNTGQLEANKQIEDAIDILKTNQLQPTGNLYKVDIPDEYIPNMLDWDKPLTQQSSEVRKALAQYMDGSDTFISPVKGSLYNPTGKQIYEAITKDTDAFSGKGSKIASEQLNQLGIKGIRYLDEGSRVAGKGTSNYVVFDPTDVKILEKNSQKVEGLLD